MIENHIEYIERFLPKYLSKDLRESLISNLKEEFPFSNDPYKLYKRIEEKEVFYQGDGMIDIHFSRLNVQKKGFDLKYLPAVIISNTCDIASENDRDYPPYVNFAAIYKLEDFITFMQRIGVKQKRIETFKTNLKNNKITSLFYLPEYRVEGKEIISESLIRFDDTSSIPCHIINEKYDKSYKQDNGDRLFSFSDYGFYLFLFKLSIHYCRIREGVFRN